MWAGRTSCQFEGLSGALKDCRVLEVELQVFPAQPGGLASLLTALVKLGPWETTHGPAKGPPPTPTSGQETSAEQSPLAPVLPPPVAFGPPVTSSLMRPGFCSFSLLGLHL